MDSTESYNYTIVKYFTVMACIYLVIGTSVGVFIASQLAWPDLNFDNPYITFGRLRSVHTNTVLYGFAGTVLVGTAYYVVQRTSYVRLWSDKLAWFTFWGWNIYMLGLYRVIPRF